MSHHSVRIEILRALSKTLGYKMPEGSLLTTLTKLLDAPVTPEEFQAGLEWLKGKAWIDWSVDDLMPEEKRWFITESGKAKI